MEATHRRHTYSICICAVLFVASCIALGRQGSAKQDDLYRAISQQFISYDIDGAKAVARKAWLSNPNSEFGWRFKLKYADILLFERRVQEAAELLKAPVPLEFSRLQSRYEYLNALLKFRQHDAGAPAAMRAAIAQAHTRSDPESEADGLIFLQGNQKSGESGGKALLTRARDIAQRNHLPYEESRALNSLGLLALQQQRYAEAIPYFNPAIALSKRIGAKYVQAAATQNLGECLFQLGDFGRALGPLLEAASLLRPNDHSTVSVNIRNDLGAYYSLTRRDEDALRYYREAFALAQLGSVTTTPYVLSSLNLASGLIQIRAMAEAEKYNEIASHASQQALNLKVDIPTEWLAEIEVNRADIAAGRGKLELAVASYARALQILSKEQANFTQVLAYAGLAEAHERLHNTEEASKNFDKALSSIESNRAHQVSAQYQIKFLSALIQFYQQYGEFLIRQHDPWKALAVADSSRASVLTQSLTSSRKERGFEARILATARETDTAFLFYSIAPQKCYLWALTPTGKEFKELALSADQIGRDVNAYSVRIDQRKDTLAETNQIGMRLYQTLIDPVASHLQPNMRVVVVPDGPLHNLNFETLLVKGRKPHYWLQDVSLTVAPSLRILLDNGKPKPVLNKALVIGDPVYTGSLYPSLPESKKEIAQVRARFPNGLKVLTQQQAVPEAYQKAQPEIFSLIHFSAHVDADSQSPLDSAIILSAGQDGNRKLYARDFKNLNADLVTVSGCRSVGDKELSGEGMVGFAWAAFDAGAQNAVTSLWAVDDRSTADLMDRFYAGVKAGRPYVTALRDAKLQMLQQTHFDKPFYWAPFQLYSRNIVAGARQALH